MNVGAGTGSYEPRGRQVVAVEPSAVMISQRRPDGAPVVRAVAESLPFRSGSFDAALAVLTVHHWPSQVAGLREVSRVARRVVVLHYDPSVHFGFWMSTDYVPETAGLESARGMDHLQIASEIGATRIETVPVPGDCSDGFYWAFWRRPERYLDPEVRSCISGLALLDAALVEERMEKLRSDLADGTWHRRHGHLLALDSVDGGFRLVIRE